MYEDTVNQVNQGRTVFSCDLIIRSLCCSMSFKLLTCVSSYLITSWRSTSLICGCKSMHLQRDKGDEGETRERRGRDDGERTRGIQTNVRESEDATRVFVTRAFIRAVAPPTKVAHAAHHVSLVSSVPPVSLIHRAYTIGHSLDSRLPRPQNVR